MHEQKPRLLRGRGELPAFREIASEAPHANERPGKAKGSRAFFVRWAAANAVIIPVLSIVGFMPDGFNHLAGALREALWKPSPAAEIEEVFVYEEFSVEKPEIMIPKIGVESVIMEPQSTNLAVLNAALTQGAVRYPGSAKPGETGNLFIFGHSTGLPVVKNQAYKLFNRVKELKAGDAIRIREGNREYLYIISNISVQKADEARIDLKSDKKLLTLVTCKLIGADVEELRYVVEAEFLRSYPLRIRTQ